MKTAIMVLLGGAAAACLSAAMPPAPAPVPVSGKIIILDNDQLIEGDIRREGDNYLIRRGDGETIVPALRVVGMVGDRKQALQLIRERANPRDWDERMRLVRWCMENELRDEALAEVEVLLKYRPNDQQLKSLARGLPNLRMSGSKPADSPAPAKPLDKVLEIEPPEFNRESFPLFVSKVQPILMNACAACHITGQGGGFKLVRTVDGSRKETLFNLAAALKQLNRADLEASPFLVKAGSAHGKSLQPPVRAAAIEYLEAWAVAAVGAEANASPPAIVSKAMEEPKRELSIPKKTAAAGSKFGETSTSQAQPEPQTEAKDPFDPAIFNGTIQPRK
jgi:hypothetical protein